MSTSYFKVLDGRGGVLGYTAHQNTADVWRGLTADTIEDCRQSKGRECSHRPTKHHVYVGVHEFYGNPPKSDDTCWKTVMLWCDKCRALIMPPFDDEEWTYHAYFCGCGYCG